MVLIGLMGHFIEFGSAVPIGGNVYYSQSFSLKLRLCFHGHKEIIRLAKAFRAVQIATRSIRNFHISLATNPPLQYSIKHLFPPPTPIDDAPLPTLSLNCRLSKAGRRYIFPRNSEEVRSGLYIAALESSERNVEVVVKFTARYSEKAHEILAKEGLAPVLHACCKVHGDLYMVVMDYVPGETV